MLRYALHRLLVSIPVVAAIVVIAFAAVRVGPGDPALRLAARGDATLAQNADVASRDYASADRVTEVRSRLGLDRPVAEQFVVWLQHLLTGDLRQSFVYRVPVATLIAQRIEPTISLAFVATALSVLLGVPLGLSAAYWQGGFFDRLVQGFCIVGFSLPAFIAGYALVYFFSIALGWLPAQGYRSIADGVMPWAQHILLPSLSIAVVFMALIASMTRAGVLDILQEDYIRTAKAKGASAKRLLYRHVLANAINPILTVTGTGAALLLGGVVVVESVFNIPGLGRLTTDAVLASDYPIVQAVVLFSALLNVCINLFIDIAYRIFDPRLLE